MTTSHSSRAIVIRTRAYGEVDVIATFLTRDFGKLTGIAKGAKHSRRRFANCLDPFTRVQVHFRTRPGAGLAFLERCELLHPAMGMAAPSRFAYGSYLLELVDKLTHEGDAISDIHDLLESGLTQIESGPTTSTLLRTFELQLLSHLGYAPPLQACVCCHRPFTAAAFGVLDADRNLFLCDTCGASARSSERFDATTLVTLARLQHLPLASCRELTLPEETARQAAALTGRLLTTHLSRPLQSLDLIASLRQARSGAL